MIPPRCTPLLDRELKADDTGTEVVPDSLVNSVDSQKVGPSVVPPTAISEPSLAMAELIELWLRLDASARAELLGIAREMAGSCKEAANAPRVL